MEPGAAAHLTGQGATPVYRSPDRTTAADRIELSVADGGVLEYLPEPRIMFPGSRIDQSLVVRAGPGGIAIVADGFLACDPDGARQSFSRYSSEIVVERPDGTVCSRDRIALDAAPARGGARCLPHAGRTTARPRPPAGRDPLRAGRPRDTLRHLLITLCDHRL